MMTGEKEKEGSEMARRNAYTVRYKTSKESYICVVAGSKAEAYEIAFYEAIPEKEGELPFSAWVESVTYQNGNQKFFNTSEGNAY